MLPRSSGFGLGGLGFLSFPVVQPVGAVAWAPVPSGFEVSRWTDDFSAETASLPTAFPVKLTPSEKDRPEGTC